MIFLLNSTFYWLGTTTRSNLHCMLDGVHFTGGEISGGIHYNITLAEQCGRYFTTQTVNK